MIVIKDQKYQSIKSEDLKPGDSIVVVCGASVTCFYNQAQVAELMNNAYENGFNAGDRTYKDNYIYSDHGDE